MLPISVCMIAKNEEACIGECLKRLSRYDWEIVVTDTGSTDRTLEIASGYTGQLHTFPWCGDFSAARNYCVEKASNAWILSIDCDEYLTTDCGQEQLEALLAPCMNFPEKAGMIELKNPHAASFHASASIDRVARFFHRDHYLFAGRVHEQLTPSLSAPGTACAASPLTPVYFDVPLCFYHIGYQQEDSLRRKAQRNIRLLEEELHRHPEDPYLYYQLGQSYFVLGDMEHACEIFDRGLCFDVDPRAQYVRTMVESYGYCLLHLKQYEKALLFENIYDDFCSHADFVFQMGLIYMNNGRFDEAVAQFEKAADTGDCSVEGLNSYCAFYNIGVIYECTGRFEKAREFYMKCGDYGPAKDALARAQ